MMQADELSTFFLKSLWLKPIPINCLDAWAVVRRSSMVWMGREISLWIWPIKSLTFWAEGP